MPDFYIRWESHVMGECENVLREEIPAEVMSESRKNHFLLLPGSCLILGQVLAFGSRPPGYGLPLTMFAGLAIALPCVGLSIFLSEFLYRRLRSSAPAFSSDGTTLWIETNRDIQKVSLSDCVVKRGRACYLRVIRPQLGAITLLSYRKVILIRTPPLTNFVHIGEAPRSIVAVGFTDEILDQWQKLLGSAIEDTPWT